MKLGKHILFVLFFMVFSFELCQKHYALLITRPLQGSSVSIDKPFLTIDNWMSGQYQECLTKYFEQNLMLRPFLIRLRNQVGYSVFGEMSNSAVILGKDRVLFEKVYLDTYMGQGFVGKDSIVKKVDKLAYVQAEFKKRNVDLFFVIAPGKASILTEYIPQQYDFSQKKISNYDVLQKQLEKKKINCIDLRNYFLKLKPTSKYPLFPKCGTHWSGYGTTIAADTIFKYMEKLRNIDLTDFYAKGGEESTQPRKTDADLGGILNLLVDIPSYKMYYPTIQFKNDKTKIKPNLLIVGDSFAWTLIDFYNYIPNLFSDKSAYWYYNTRIDWDPSDMAGGLVKDLDLKEQTFHRDFIMIINAEAALGEYGQGFIEQMYELFKKDTLSSPLINATLYK